MEYSYCIRQAVLKDKNKIVDFFNREWKKNQTINDEILFSYYYINDNKLNFVIAIREEEIVGACGFIIAEGTDVWLSNLSVKKGENPMLVLKMINFLAEKNFNLFGMGIEKNTQGFYKILGYKTGELKHYYKLFDWKEYKIATIFDKKIYTNMSDQYRVTEIISEKMLTEKVNDSFFFNQRPRKSLSYLIKRYFRFPYPQYQYKVWAVEPRSENNISTIIVTREQEVKLDDCSRRVLRIVDIVGDEEKLSGTGKFFEEQGIANKYEYIDCWCYGIKNGILEKLGFVCDDGNIIPERLEPLEKKNAEIIIFYRDDADFRAFRADGDWDRPNIWYHAPLNEI